jgi:vacuolar-type H+-ATPase subunit E/Vma4
MDRDPGLTAQLAPLEAAVIAAARKDADAQLEAAKAKAAAVVAEAEGNARAVLEQAASEGRGAAKRAAEHRLVDGRRQARRLILGAQQAAYQHLVREAIRATEDLRQRPEYTDLERRLIETAKDVLGADAEIVPNPDGHGGVRASAGGRTVDLTLTALARRCIERLGEDVTRLWA